MALGGRPKRLATLILTGQLVIASHPMLSHQRPECPYGKRAERRVTATILVEWTAVDI